MVALPVHKDSHNRERSEEIALVYAACPQFVVPAWVPAWQRLYHMPARRPLRAAAKAGGCRTAVSHRETRDCQTPH